MAAESALDCLAQLEEMDEISSTYAAIDREEMMGVFDECQELGLVSSNGAVTRA
jgi:hypothetical protein